MAFGADGLVSSDIVGYQTKSVRKNLSVQIATFDEIDEDGLDIQKIKPIVPDGEEIVSGDFTIQIYGDTGVIQAQYMYVLGEDIDDGFADGWYEEDWETLVEKKFEAGEGFNVSAAKVGYLKFPAL